MMRTSRFLAGCIPLLMATCAFAGDGEIGIYFDSEAKHCRASVPCGQVGRLYIFAELEGASLQGITGVEYGMRMNADNDADPGWRFEEDFVPGTVVLGTGAFAPTDVTRPFELDRRYRGRGVNVAWPECQTGDGSRVLLETVEVVNEGCTEFDLHLLVTSHDTPSNQFFQCPLFTLCDDPVFTKVCLGTNLTLCQNPEPPYAMDATCSSSRAAVIHATEGPPIPCRATAVQPSTWTQVKRLYGRER